MLWEMVGKCRAALSENRQKVPFVVGFLSRSLEVDGRLRMYEKFPDYVEIMMNNLSNSGGGQYKSSLIMLAAFFKGWHQEGV